MNSKQMTTFKKLFKEKQNDLGEGEIAEEERLIYVEPSNVLGVIPKTERAKHLLTKTFDLGEGNKVPKLDYSGRNGGTSKYSTEFIKIIFGLMQADDYETIKISVGDDYPLKVELKEFDILLAPRVDTEGF